MFLYRLLLSLALPFLALGQWRRIRRGQETRADAAQRQARGLPGPGPGTGATPAPIWLHAASNGEVTAARPVIDALLGSHPMIITCNSVSGRALVQGWGLVGVNALLAPLDTRAALRRFLDHWTPKALITIENELWPNRLGVCAARAIPAAVLSARMSSDTERKWRWIPGLARRILGQIALLSPQDAASGPRFVALGLPARALGAPVGLKSAALDIRPDPATLAEFRAEFVRSQTVLAASTHPGEEEAVLSAFVKARAKRPALRLILAPRHPARAAEVLALAAKSGLSTAQRSQGPAAGADVYLLDTLGELPAAYGAAACAFVGGSLVAKGGHTAYEPAAMGCAILHGPHVENAATIYGALDAGGGAVLVQDADALANRWTHLSPKAMLGMAEASLSICQQASAPEILDDWITHFIQLVPKDAP